MHLVIYSINSYYNVITTSLKFLKVSKEKSFIIISLVFCGLFFHDFTTTTLALCITCLSWRFFMDLKVPAQRMFFHKFVPSNQRASIASVEAMIGHLFTAIAFPIAGYLTDHFSARYAIFISGSLSLRLLFISIFEKKLRNVKYIH